MTEDEENIIRTEYANGTPVAALALHYGLRETLIRRIISPDQPLGFGDPTRTPHNKDGTRRLTNVNSE